MSKRFEAIGSFVYEKGNRIGVTPDEASVELARKLNAYQMRIERLKAEVERLESDNLKLKDDLERQIETRNYFINKMMLKIKHIDLLTSSGDNLQNALLKLTSGTPDWNQEIFWNWNAAKEGKQP